MANESRRREIADLVTDTSINRHFIREIDTERHDSIWCGLKYSHTEKFAGWVIEILVNHRVYDAYLDDEGCCLCFIRMNQPPYKPPDSWFDPIGMISSEAARFDITEDTRQLLNNGLVFLNENAPAPEITDDEIRAPLYHFNLEVIEEALEYQDLYDRVELDMYDKVDTDLLPASKLQAG